MVLSNRVLATSYRLTIVTVFQSAAAWPQFFTLSVASPVPIAISLFELQVTTQLMAKA